MFKNVPALVIFGVSYDSCAVWDMEQINHKLVYRYDEMFEEYFIDGIGFGCIYENR